MPSSTPAPLSNFTNDLSKPSHAQNHFGHHPAEKARYIQAAHQDSSKAEMWALICELDSFRTF